MRAILTIIGSSIFIQEKKIPWTNLPYTQQAIDALMRMALSLIFI